jgi:hypothetical protein
MKSFTSICVLTGLLTVTTPAAEPPCPRSKLVTGLTWAPDIVRLGGERTGDNWPIAWGDDDILYTSWGDGPGFQNHNPQFTIGFAAISGDPQMGMNAREIPSNIDAPMGGGKTGIKSSALIMVNRVLYMWVRNIIIDGDFRHSRIAVSKDLSRTWTWADWHFSETFGCPEFVQFGKNFEGARDNYVYVVSQDNNDPYLYSTDVVLARVRKDRIAERNAYEFFAGSDSTGKPIWAAEIARRKTIFTDPKGVQRVAMSYNPALRRYFLVSSIGTDGSATRVMHTGGLGVYEAPEPWGPWRTVYYNQYWSGGKDGKYALEEWTYHQKFPPKFMSPDGKTMWLLFSGRGPNYTFCLKKATLEISSGR